MRNLLAILLLPTAGILSAQEVTQSIENEAKPKTETSAPEISLPPPSFLDYQFPTPPAMGYSIAPSYGSSYNEPFNFSNDPTANNFAGAALIHGWNNGMIYAEGSHNHYPGMLGIESGSLNLMQRLGNLTLSGSLSANKFGYFRGLSTIYGVSGSASWKFNDRWAFTVFGAYHGNANLPYAAMAGYAPATRYGGYFSFNFHEKWGVDLGAQRMQSYGNGWQTVPIIAPYYRIKDDVKIQIDMGGILHQLLDNSSNYNRGNPTIGPPIQRTPLAPQGPPR